MKFLCLAYGAEADWRALSAEEQAALLAQKLALDHVTPDPSS